MVRAFSLALVASLLVAASADVAPAHINARGHRVGSREGVKVPRYAVFPRHIKRQEPVRNGTTPDPTPDRPRPTPVDDDDPTTTRSTASTTRSADPTDDDGKPVDPTTTSQSQSQSTSDDGGIGIPILTSLTSGLGSIIDP